MKAIQHAWIPLLIGISLLSVFIILEIYNPITTKDIDRKTTPNKGIWNSLKNGSIVYLIVGSILGLVISIFKDRTTGILYGLVLGLIYGLKYGGITTIKHFVLRLILCIKDNIPWNYARFLDRASDLLLMKKVGGGYIFYHRMLMEHFANMELEE